MALHCPKCTCEWDTLISSSSVLLYLPFCIQHSSCDDHLHMEFRYVTRILWNGCVSRILFSFFSFAFALSLSLCIVNAILSFHFSAAIFFISAVHSFFFLFSYCCHVLATEREPQGREHQQQRKFCIMVDIKG